MGATKNGVAKNSGVSSYLSSITLPHILFQFNNHSVDGLCGCAEISVHDGIIKQC